MSKYADIIKRLEKATGGDTELDARIWATLAGVKYVSHNKPYNDMLGQTQVVYTVPPKRTKQVTNERHTPHAKPVTSSIDAAVALVEKMLPGWAWTIGKCHLSDDAWVAPDFNSPEHGVRLRGELLGGREPVKGDVWDDGFDVDQRPQKAPQIALLIALFRALEAKEAV